MYSTKSAAFVGKETIWRNFSEFSTFIDYIDPICFLEGKFSFKRSSPQHLRTTERRSEQRTKPMNKILLLGGLLLSILGTVGCACYSPGYGPGYGYGNCGNPCSGAIAPYSCGPSSCGGQGVDYVDGGPAAGNADCGGNYSPGYCGSPNGCNGYYGSGDCGRCVGNGLRVIGEGAVGLVAAPFVFVGSLLNCGGYGNYSGCGCSNEVYYGDNCYQPHDFCDPCGGNANGGNVCSSAGPDRVGHAYPPTAPGCSQCSGGYSEGVQTTEPTTASPQPTPRPMQRYIQTSMQRPGQQPVMVR